MTTPVDNTPVGEVIQQEGSEPQAPQDQPVGEVLETKPEPAKVESVPLSRLNKEIARRKELEAEVERLRQEPAMTKVEIDEEIDRLAKEHDVDPAFLDKFADSVRAKLEASVEEKLRPFTERDKAAAQKAKFDEHYKKTIASLPEYADIANPQVIMQLALNPANASKTMAQLIEETYGNVPKGRKTMETTVPRGGVDVEGIDFNRAKTDGAYFKEIMADPKLKAEYNSQLTRTIRL